MTNNNAIRIFNKCLSWTLCDDNIFISMDTIGYIHANCRTNISTLEYLTYLCLNLPSISYLHNLQPLVVSYLVTDKSPTVNAGPLSTMLWLPVSCCYN